MTWLARFLIIVFLSAPARAEDEKPYLPQKPSYTVMVAGDSLAAGLWSGLARVAESNLRLSIDGRYKEDSGLARPEVYDWNTALPKILAANPVDIVVIMLGSNDAQSIREGAARYAFGTPEWSAAYEARVAGLLASLKEAGVAVYWVGQPPMESQKFDGAAREIGDIQKSQAEAAGVRHIGIRAAFSDAEDKFIETGADDTGEARRLRSNDGVHFLRPGNNKLGLLVLSAIRADIDAADGVDAPAAEAKPEPPAEGPVFGQDAAEGGQILVTAAPSEDLPAVKPAAQTGPLKIIAGSNAQRLFVDGLSKPAPRGRFDDFTIPAP
jgi:uncharacterized protein